MQNIVALVEAELRGVKPEKRAKKLLKLARALNDPKVVPIRKPMLRGPEA